MSTEDNDREEPQGEKPIEITPRRGHTQVPNTFWTVCQKQNLEPGERLCLIALMSHDYTNNGCFPSEELLARYLNRNKRTVGRYIKILKKKGLIKVKRRKGTSNKYHLTALYKEMEEPSIDEGLKEDSKNNGPATKRKLSASDPGKALKTYELYFGQLRKNYPEDNHDTLLLSDRCTFPAWFKLMKLEEPDKLDKEILGNLQKQKEAEIKKYPELKDILGSD